MNYENTKPDYVLDVLGVPYAIYGNVLMADDEYLKTCAGYCEKTVKRIVVSAAADDNELEDYSVYQKSVLRHEIIHAFMHESGIDGNTTWDIAGEEHPEKAVAWFALQAPKLYKAFKAVNAL